MDIVALRKMNDDLRQQAIIALRRFNRAEVFAEAVEHHMHILAQVELMDQQLDELEKKVDSQQA